MENEKSLSIEETNKLRAQLGLKPLKVEEAGDGKTAEYNYMKHMQDLKKKREKEEIRLEVQKSKEKWMREQKVEGKTLAEEEDTELDDAAEWVARSKRRQLQIEEERKRKREDGERRRKQALAQEHTAEDLSGVLVGHSAENFDDMDTGTMLVLKDVDVLQGDDDELVNAEILLKEQKHRYDEITKKKISYDDGQMDKKLLDYYDEEIDSKKIGFRINGQLTKQKIEKRVEDSIGRPVESLDVDGFQVANDYLAPEEVSFKKVKKKKTTRSFKKFDNDSEITIPASNISLKETNFVDDEDLQASLALARGKVRQTKKSFLEVADEVLNQMEETPAVSNDNRLVISETSEFVQNLVSAPLDKTEVLVAVPGPHYSSSHIQDMQDIDRVKDTIDDDDDQKMDVDIEMPSEEETLPEELHKQTMNKGLGSTLKLLQSRGGGFETSQDISADHHGLSRFASLEDRKKKIEAEQNEQRRARMEARLAEDVNEMFKDYKPQLNLDHVDEFGRVMTYKEAWKQLCYKFHGKGPGKTKTEKRLKKIAQELKMKQRQQKDTVVDMENVTKTAGQAHVVLGVGNRNIVPGLSKDERDLTIESHEKESKLGTKTVSVAFTPIPSQLLVKRTQPKPQPVFAQMELKAIDQKKVTRKPNVGFKSVAAPTQPQSSSGFKTIQPATKPVPEPAIQAPKSRPKLQFGIPSAKK